MKNTAMKPYFIWDYDIDEETLRSYLTGSDLFLKRWAETRILSHANIADVWRYLSADEIAKNLPQLKLSPQIRTLWERALEAWGYHVAT